MFGLAALAYRDFRALGRGSFAAKGVQDPDAGGLGLERWRRRPIPAAAVGAEETVPSPGIRLSTKAFAAAAREMIPGASRQAWRAKSNGTEVTNGIIQPL